MKGEVFESTAYVDRAEGIRGDIVDVMMGRMDCELEKEVSTAYIDSCAGDHVWRMDSGIKYLKDIKQQNGRYVRGITVDKKRLTHNGMNEVLGRVNMGEVTTNLISLPQMLNKGGKFYGDDKKCIMWDLQGKVCIKGKREGKGMYCCDISQLVQNNDDNVDLMAWEGQVIDEDGVIRTKHLSGEEISRAKEARNMHLALHVSEEKLKIRLDNGCYENSKGLSGKDVSNAINIFGKCRACLKANMKRPSKDVSRSIPAPKIGYRLAVDILILKHVSLGGNLYVLFGVDDKCGCIFLNGMKSKLLDNIKEALKSMVVEIFSYGHVVKEILFDNEAVFNAARDYARERNTTVLHSFRSA